jgi:hypothetical protein
MSVVDVTKMWSKSGGSFTSETYDPFDQQWALTEGYQVLVDDPTDDAVVVASALGIPPLGAQHPSGIDAEVSSIVPVPLGPVFWMVTVTYTGETIEPGTVDVEWTDVTTTEPCDRDWNGAAIVTENGEQVDGLSVDVSDQVVIIRRKFATINPAALREYRRSTNSDTYLGWPPGTARLVGLSAKNRFKFGQVNEAWDVTARIQFREPFAGTTPAQAWYKRWRHEGLLVKDGTDIRRAVDSYGQQKTRPVLLKADGTEETDPDAAVFIHTQVYGSIPYSALGLV